MNSTNKEKFLIVGSGGRESAFAQRLAEDTELYAVIGHNNPTIIEYVLASGGSYLVANPSDAQIVSAYAKKHNIDYAFVSADEPLASGVIDALLKAKIKAVGGTKEATKIEWDKIYSIELVNKVCPEFTPFYKVVHSIDEVSRAIAEFKRREIQVVVKPQGLTGGKGVKIMPEHLTSYEAAADYASALFTKRPNEKVLLVEKLKGIEFTIMGLTDGKNLVLSPATYDYPFRLENDLGAGTGGMGCFTNNEKKLPFMSESHLSDCAHIMKSVIHEMKKAGLFFNGVLNGGFFVTQNGIKFMEFNGRFGDPEGLNILSIIKSPFSKLIKDLWHQTLSESSVAFINKASVIKYLVAKAYPEASQEVIDFTVDEESIKKLGVNLFFGAAVKKDTQHYETLKTSRVVAVGSVAHTVAEASQTINFAIDNYIKGNLEYRKDIGSSDNLAKLITVAKSL